MAQAREAQIVADTQLDTETRKSDFQRAPRGGGRTPPAWGLII